LQAVAAHTAQCLVRVALLEDSDAADLVNGSLDSFLKGSAGVVVRRVDVHVHRLRGPLPGAGERVRVTTEGNDTDGWVQHQEHDDFMDAIAIPKTVCYRMRKV